MSTQPLGKLWVCLSPNNYELRDCGSRIFYQQQIILELIEQFGFDQAVFLFKKTVTFSTRKPTTPRTAAAFFDFPFDPIINCINLL
jgi:hypothetical protein